MRRGYIPPRRTRLRKDLRAYVRDAEHPHARGRADPEEQPAADPRGEQGDRAAWRDRDRPVGRARALRLRQRRGGPRREDDRARLVGAWFARHCPLRDSLGNSGRRLHFRALSARRVLVVGQGGREHALVRTLLRSEAAPEVLATPGNAGIARDGVECLPAGDVVEAARERDVDLVVVGPEAPLVAGLVDELAAAGIAAFGPSKAAARIEGSKAYAKELMRSCGVPTASHVLFRDREEAVAHMACASYPAVLKADVLAAGKGVIIAADEREARAALDVFFAERRFGDTEVVLEEFLEGEELSLLALCDGERAVPLAPAQDYKRIFDGDQGPNTGGMGSYSPVPGVDADRAEEIAAIAHQPVVDELCRRGTPFHGVLYAGLMMTAAGPKVLEYNCRFGDPETQAVLSRLRSDLLELLLASTRRGGLEGAAPEWSS